MGVRRQQAAERAGDRAFHAGLAATALVAAARPGWLPYVLVTAEAAVTSLCAAALIMTFLSRAPAPAVTGVALAARRP